MHIDLLNHSASIFAKNDATNEDVEKAIKAVSEIMKLTVGMNEDWLNFIEASVKNTPNLNIELLELTTLFRDRLILNIK